MIIIFGWEKRIEAVKVVFESYCYNCQRETDWIHGVESEWATFFDVGVLRFKKTDFLLCDICCDDFDLDSRATKKLKELKNSKSSEHKDWIVSGFSQLIENHQLANKTETQLEFIRSARKYAMENDSDE